MVPAADHIDPRAVAHLPPMTPEQLNAVARIFRQIDARRTNPPTLETKNDQHDTRIRRADFLISPRQRSRPEHNRAVWLMLIPLSWRG